MGEIWRSIALPTRGNFSSLELVMFSAFAISFALVLIEAYVLIVRRRERYAWRASAISTVIAVGQALTSPLSTPWLAALIFAPIYAHRVHTIALDTWWKWLVLWFVVELVYYWFHRWNHRVRWFWATHAVHHSSEYMNLTAAYRFGWTGVLSGYFMIWAPLVWIGLLPTQLFAILTLSMLYQGWLHTETIRKLPRWFELSFNTPSRHRVHHAVDPAYRDRNFGGVLLIFDHLFGTVADEQPDKPPRYGLVQPIGTDNPIEIVFHGWRVLFRELIAASSWRERVRLCVRPPDEEN